MEAAKILLVLMITGVVALALFARWGSAVLILAAISAMAAMITLYQTYKKGEI